MDPFERVRLLIGDEGLARLSQARVAVIGLGGVGSAAAEALARAPIGHLLLVDDDRVAPGDINRQLHASHATLGRPKAEVMAERARAINPAGDIQHRVCRFSARTAETLLEGVLDYVVDAIDDTSGKVALLLECVSRSIPVVSSMGAASKLDPAAVRVDDISRTRHCPLARELRKRLRKAGVSTGIKAVFSEEAPIKLQTDAGVVTEGRRGTGDTRRPQGTISCVPPVFGFNCAAVVIQDLLTGLRFERQGWQ